MLPPEPRNLACFLCDNDYLLAATTIRLDAEPGERGDGNMRGSVGACIDLTERQGAEEYPLQFDELRTSGTGDGCPGRTTGADAPGTREPRHDT